MHLSTHSFATPAENLALEEAWLDMAEEGLLDTEILRVWQPTSAFVVVGRGSQVAREVNLQAAEAAGMPVMRRISGGAAIVAGPGCLMYAVMLSYQRRPHLRMLDEAHRTVMQAMVQAIAPQVPKLSWDGTCDLVVDAHKVSGNSLRCRREWLLYHGTLLLDMDLQMIDQFLLHPPREPEYRQRRPHAQFVTNLGLEAESLVGELARVWDARAQNLPLPSQRVEQLVRERYSNQAWNFER